LRLTSKTVSELCPKLPTKQELVVILETHEESSYVPSTYM